MKFEVGETHGRLVALRRIRGPYWLWKCDCGVEKMIKASNVRSGNTQSCGCLSREIGVVRNRRHGMRSAPEYSTWNQMKQRCHNPNNPKWKNYGGRGIAVCPEWFNSFEAFLAHIGPKPSPDLSIDRINNDRGYYPGNVRWATDLQQQQNKRTRKAA